jgi:pilus assembly protein Flp/PilA
VAGDTFAAQLSGVVTMEERAIMALVSRFIHQESGQDLIEYALLAAFISVAAVAAITTIGTALNTSYNNVHAQIVAAP